MVELTLTLTSDEIQAVQSALIHVSLEKKEEIVTSGFTDDFLLEYVKEAQHFERQLNSVYKKINQARRA